MSCDNCPAINQIKEDIKIEKERNYKDYGIGLSGNPMIHLVNISGQICNGCQNQPSLKDVLGQNHPDSIQYSG